MTNIVSLQTLLVIKLQGRLNLQVGQTSGDFTVECIDSTGHTMVCPAMSLVIDSGSTYIRINSDNTITGLAIGVATVYCTAAGKSSNSMVVVVSASTTCPSNLSIVLTM